MDSETVAGRLMMTGRSAVGAKMRSTSLQISAAKSISVPVKDSGEYSKRTSAPGRISSRRRTQSSAPVVAMRTISSRVLWKTCSRWARDVGL